MQNRVGRSHTKSARVGAEKCPINTFSIGGSDQCSSCSDGEYSQPGSSVLSEMSVWAVLQFHRDVLRAVPQEHLRHLRRQCHLRLQRVRLWLALPTRIIILREVLNGRVLQRNLHVLRAVPEADLHHLWRRRHQQLRVLRGRRAFP